MEKLHQRGLQTLAALPESGSTASPTNGPSYAQVVHNGSELEFLSHYKDRGYDSFISWFNPSKDGWYMGGATVRQRIATDDPRKVAGETALTITIESMPKIVTQCPDEASFEAAWAEFTARLAALPLREYEELATQMIKDSVPLYQHQGRQNAPAIPKGKRPELGSGRFPSAF